MTDLPEEERKALEAVDHIGYLIRRFATIKDREAGEHLVRDLATIQSALAAREYSKQREEKLEEALKPLVDWAATLVPENDVRDGLIAAGRAALAENGEGQSDSVRNRLVVRRTDDGLQVTFEEHVFSVCSSFTGPGEWVECSCGWASPEFPSQSEALEWAREQHGRERNPGGLGDRRPGA